MGRVSNVRRARLLRRRQRGLTLIEAAMVLGVAALVIAGVLVLYNTANTSSKTSDTLNQLNIIQQAVRSVYGGQANFTGLDNSVLTGANALPSRMISGTGIYHAFNGPITVAEDTTSGGWSVQFDKLPVEACTQLATKDYGRALIGLMVGSTDESATIATGLLDAKTAGADCKGGNSGGSTTVKWTFQN